MSKICEKILAFITIVMLVTGGHLAGLLLSPVALATTLTVLAAFTILIMFGGIATELSAAWSITVFTCGFAIVSAAGFAFVSTDILILIAAFLANEAINDHHARKGA